MSTESRANLFGRKRTANAEDGPRQKRYVVKVTPAEQAALEGRAIEARVTVQRLMLESALSDAPETITERRQLAVELSEVRQLLANLANNANQLAKYANTEGHIADWANDVLLDYRAARPRINAVIDGLFHS